jgi:hypothetical protein
MVVVGAELDELFGTDLGDRDVWAKNIRKAGTAAKRKVPKQLDLEKAISSIKLTDTIDGSSTIEVVIEDVANDLLESRTRSSAGGSPGRSSCAR